MKFMERRIQTLERDKWDVYWSREKRWMALEQRLGGFPPKRHYRPLSDLGKTVVWERDWESYAAMEAAYEKLFADPEAQELFEIPSAIVDECIELYSIHM